MKYKVKLSDGHKATEHQITPTGYLGIENVEMIYSRGDAVKKANMFGGKIEVVPLSKVLTTLSITQIPENALTDWVVRQLQEREVFQDTDTELSEKIYSGDVFEAILCEYGELEGTPLYPQEKQMKHLSDLSQMIDTDYIMVTKI
jgi:hypothetical protein